MSDAEKTVSAVVKDGMARACRDFTQAVAPLGFRRTGSRSRSWKRRTDRWLQVIYFHRSGCSYGAPISHEIDIRVEFYLQNNDGTPSSLGHLISDPLRDARGYAYHLRFNAKSGSMYERCLEDLLRITREHGLPWFKNNGA